MASIAIEKLMYWRAGNWIIYDQRMFSAILKIQCNQIIITSDNKIHESFNTNSKIKGFYKGDVLILVVVAADFAIRKIKFRVKENFEKCLELLGRYFPIVSHHGSNNTNVFSNKYRNVEEIVKGAIEAIGKGDDSIKMPDNYTNFVKLCLLDPTFPQFVKETQMILDKLEK